MDWVVFKAACLHWALNNPLLVDSTWNYFVWQGWYLYKEYSSNQRVKILSIEEKIFQVGYTFSSRGTLCCSPPTSYYTVVGGTGKFSGGLRTVSMVSTHLYLYRCSTKTPVARYIHEWQYWATPQAFGIASLPLVHNCCNNKQTNLASPTFL